MVIFLLKRYALVKKQTKKCEENFVILQSIGIIAIKNMETLVETRTLCMWAAIDC